MSAVEFMTLRSARRARVTVSKVAGNHGAHQRNLLVQRNFLDRGIGVQAGLWNFLGYSLRSIFIVTARAGEADSRATHASGFDQRNSSCLNYTRIIFTFFLLISSYFRISLFYSRASWIARTTSYQDSRIFLPLVVFSSRTF